MHAFAVAYGLNYALIFFRLCAGIRRTTEKASFLRGLAFG
jgi:hypothetical protein